MWQAVKKSYILIGRRRSIWAETVAIFVSLEGCGMKKFEKQGNFLGKCCLYWLINIYSIVDCTEIEKLLISVYVIVRQNNPFMKKKIIV